MHPEAKKELRLRFKLIVLDYANHFGPSETCREFEIPTSTFYEWKKRYKKEGVTGLRYKKPIAETYPGKITQGVENIILQVRREYQLGPIRIMWYLERYHGITISESSVYRVLKRNTVSLLTESAPKRAIHTKRYAKTVPGHHIQVDVKFLTLKDDKGKKTKRFQYTAIDDATRIRALKIYYKHTQQNAIQFINYVVDMFPFRIHTIRTDRGHEFQALFHWHVEDQGMKHVYIKPRSPQLNGKVERSHRTDQDEFYQLLTYKNDVDLNEKLKVWERFYNLYRPHMAFNGKTPYEELRSILN